MKIYFRSFFAIGIFILSPSAYAEVELHLAFTANEASAVLKTLAKNNPNKTIVIVSNRDMDEDQIFGHSRSFYSKSGHADSAVAKEIKAGLEKAHIADGKSEDMTQFLIPNAKAMTSGKADLSVITLNENDGESHAAKDTIVVLQSPELGQQSTLLREYLKKTLPVFAALPEASAAKGGIHLASFGTAGGVAAGGGAGDVDSIKSSVFVGTEVVPGSSPKKFQGLISFVSLNDPKSPYVLFKSAPLDGSEDAQSTATNAFIALSKPGKCQFQDSVQALQEAVIESYKKIIASSGASLTTSFFADSEMKSAANLMNIKNVNMEDFHVIKAINDSKLNGVKFSTVNLKRMTTDPPAVSPEAISTLTRWFKDASYSKSDYEDAILWGLKGHDLDHPPASAKWKVFDSLPSGEGNKLVSKIPFTNGSAALDPFYYGLSESFLNRIGDPDFIANLVRESSSKSADPAEIEKKSKLLTQLAQSVRNGVNLPEQEQRARVDLLLDAAKNIKVGEGNVPLLGDNNNFKVPSFVDETLQLSGTTTKTLLSSPLSSKSMDRILYRHSLITLEQSSGSKATLDNQAKIKAAVDTSTSLPN